MQEKKNKHFKCQNIGKTNTEMMVCQKVEGLFYFPQLFRSLLISPVVWGQREDPAE